MGLSVLQVEFQIIDDIVLIEELERVGQVRSGDLTFDIDIHAFKYSLNRPGNCAYSFP
jgi:hypothetical protein